MLRKMFALSLSLGLPAIALAQDGASYECALGDAVRRVEIVYETGVAVPCEVHYIKETEAPGQREVLWNAQNESGYCEGRTREFVARLASLGWNCVAAASSSADDTDVLAAPEAQ
jgi:hypothetical protein